MGFDANFSVVTPDGEEELFYMDKGSISLHELIVHIVSGEIKEKKQLIRNKGECKLTLQQAFELVEVMSTLRSQPELQMELEWESDESENHKGKFRSLDYQLEQLNKTFVKLFRSVHEGELNINFIYFRYEFC